MCPSNTMSMKHLISDSIDPKLKMRIKISNSDLNLVFSNLKWFFTEESKLR